MLFASRKSKTFFHSSHKEVGDGGEVWQEVLKSMGKDYSIIANFPENPQMN